MANGTIQISFTPCDPPPANGYIVAYRKVGEGSYSYLTEITSSPVSINIDDYTPGDVFDGYIRSDCGDNVYGDVIPWIIDTSDSSGSGSGGSSSGDEGSVSIYLRFTPSLFVYICMKAIEHVYISSPHTDIATGIIIYDDENMTIPHTGDNYVQALSGVIYHIDPVTGLVGADSGETHCPYEEFEVKVSTVISDVCGKTPITVYTSSILNSGSHVYTDSLLTVPLTGYKYINRSGYATIYHIDDITGVIGFPSGSTC